MGNNATDAYKASPSCPKGLQPEIKQGIRAIS